MSVIQSNATGSSHPPRPPVRAPPDVAGHSADLARLGTQFLNATVGPTRGCRHRVWRSAERWCGRIAASSARLTARRRRAGRQPALLERRRAPIARPNPARARVASAILSWLTHSRDPPCASSRAPCASSLPHAAVIQPQSPLLHRHPPQTQRRTPAKFRSRPTRKPRSVFLRNALFLEPVDVIRTGVTALLEFDHLTASDHMWSHGDWGIIAGPDQNCRFANLSDATRKVGSVTKNGHICSKSNSIPW